MTDKDLFNKNLEIAGEFSRYMVAHPDMSEKLPPDCEILFLVDSDPALTQGNLTLAERIKKEGGKVVFIHIKTLLPKESSRLVEPRIELSVK